MSGIYIPGIGMPQRDEVITIYTDGTAHRHHLGLRLSISESKAVPVPEHGRLIDASEEITVQMYDEQHEDWLQVKMTIGDLLSCGWVDANAPTIIPADPVKEEQT